MQPLGGASFAVLHEEDSDTDITRKTLLRMSHVHVTCGSRRPQPVARSPRRIRSQQRPHVAAAGRCCAGTHESAAHHVRPCCISRATARALGFSGSSTNRGNLGARGHHILGQHSPPASQAAQWRNNLAPFKVAAKLGRKETQQTGALKHQLIDLFRNCIPNPWHVHCHLLPRHINKPLLQHLTNVFSKRKDFRVALR